MNTTKHISALKRIAIGTVAGIQFAAFFACIGWAYAEGKRKEAVTLAAVLAARQVGDNLERKGDIYPIPYEKVVQEIKGDLESLPLTQEASAQAFNLALEAARLEGRY